MICEKSTRWRCSCNSFQFLASVKNKLRTETRLKFSKFSKFSMSNLYPGFTCWLSFEFKIHSKRTDSLQTLELCNPEGHGKCLNCKHLTFANNQITEKKSNYKFSNSG